MALRPGRKKSAAPVPDASTTFVQNSVRFVQVASLFQRRRDTNVWQPLTKGYVRLQVTQCTTSTPTTRSVKYTMTALEGQKEVLNVVLTPSLRVKRQTTFIQLLLANGDSTMTGARLDSQEHAVQFENCLLQIAPARSSPSMASGEDGKGVPRGNASSSSADTISVGSTGSDTTDGADSAQVKRAAKRQAPAPPRALSGSALASSAPASVLTQAVTTTDGAPRNPRQAPPARPSPYKTNIGSSVSAPPSRSPSASSLEAHSLPASATTSPRKPMKRQAPAPPVERRATVALVTIPHATSSSPPQEHRGMRKVISESNVGSESPRRRAPAAPPGALGMQKAQSMQALNKVAAAETQQRVSQEAPASVERPSSEVGRSLDFSQRSRFNSDPSTRPAQPLPARVQRPRSPPNLPPPPPPAAVGVNDPAKQDVEASDSLAQESILDASLNSIGEEEERNSTETSPAQPKPFAPTVSTAAVAVEGSPVFAHPRHGSYDSVDGADPFSMPPPPDNISIPHVNTTSTPSGSSLSTSYVEEFDNLLEDLESMTNDLEEVPDGRGRTGSYIITADDDEDDDDSGNGSAQMLSYKRIDEDLAASKSTITLAEGSVSAEEATGSVELLPPAGSGAAAPPPAEKPKKAPPKTTSKPKRPPISITTFVEPSKPTPSTGTDHSIATEQKSALPPAAAKPGSVAKRNSAHGLDSPTEKRSRSGSGGGARWRSGSFGSSLDKDNEGSPKLVVKQVSSLAISPATASILTPRFTGSRDSLDKTDGDEGKAGSNEKQETQSDRALSSDNEVPQDPSKAPDGVVVRRPKPEKDNEARQSSGDKQMKSSRSSSSMLVLNMLPSSKGGDDSKRKTGTMLFNLPPPPSGASPFALRKQPRPVSNARLSGEFLPPPAPGADSIGLYDPGDALAGNMPSPPRDLTVTALSGDLPPPPPLSTEEGDGGSSSVKTETESNNASEPKKVSVVAKTTAKKPPVTAPKTRKPSASTPQSDGPTSELASKLLRRLKVEEADKSENSDGAKNVGGSGVSSRRQNEANTVPADSQSLAAEEENDGSAESYDELLHEEEKIIHTAIIISDVVQTLDLPTVDVATKKHEGTDAVILDLERSGSVTDTMTQESLPPPTEPTVADGTESKSVASTSVESNASTDCGEENPTVLASESLSPPEEPVAAEETLTVPASESLPPPEEPVAAEENPTVPTSESLPPPEEPVAAEENPTVPASESLPPSEEPVAAEETPTVPTSESLPPPEEPVAAEENPTVPASESLPPPEEPVAAEETPTVPTSESLPPPEEPVAAEETPTVTTSKLLPPPEEPVAADKSSSTVVSKVNTEQATPQPAPQPPPVEVAAKGVEHKPATMSAEPPPNVDEHVGPNASQEDLSSAATDEAEDSTEKNDAEQKTENVLKVSSQSTPAAGEPDGARSDPTEASQVPASPGIQSGLIRTHKEDGATVDGISCETREAISSAVLSDSPDTSTQGDTLQNQPAVERVATSDIQDNVSATPANSSAASDDSRAPETPKIVVDEPAVHFARDTPDDIASLPRPGTVLFDDDFYISPSVPNLDPEAMFISPSVAALDLPDIPDDIAMPGNDEDELDLGDEVVIESGLDFPPRTPDPCPGVTSTGDMALKEFSGEPAVANAIVSPTTLPQPQPAEDLETNRQKEQDIPAEIPIPSGTVETSPPCGGDSNQEKAAAVSEVVAEEMQNVCEGDVSKENEASLGEKSRDAKPSEPASLDHSAPQGVLPAAAMQSPADSPPTETPESTASNSPQAGNAGNNIANGASELASPGHELVDGQATDLAGVDCIQEKALTEDSPTIDTNTLDGKEDTGDTHSSDQTGLDEGKISSTSDTAVPDIVTDSADSALEAAAHQSKTDDSLATDATATTGGEPFVSTSTPPTKPSAAVDSPEEISKVALGESVSASTKPHTEPVVTDSTALGNTATAAESEPESALPSDRPEEATADDVIAGSDEKTHAVEGDTSSPLTESQPEALQEDNTTVDGQTSSLPEQPPLTGASSIPDSKDTAGKENSEVEINGKEHTLMGEPSSDLSQEESSQTKQEVENCTESESTPVVAVDLPNTDADPTQTSSKSVTEKPDVEVMPDDGSKGDTATDHTAQDKADEPDIPTQPELTDESKPSSSLESSLTAEGLQSSPADDCQTALESGETETVASTGDEHLGTITEAAPPAAAELLMSGPGETSLTAPDSTEDPTLKDAASTATDIAEQDKATQGDEDEKSVGTQPAKQVPSEEQGATAEEAPAPEDADEKRTTDDDLDAGGSLLRKEVPPEQDASTSDVEKTEVGGAATEDAATVATQQDDTKTGGNGTEATSNTAEEKPEEKLAMKPPPPILGVLSSSTSPTLSESSTPAPGSPPPLPLTSPPPFPLTSSPSIDDIELEKAAEAVKKTSRVRFADPEQEPADDEAPSPPPLPKVAAKPKPAPKTKKTKRDDLLRRDSKQPEAFEELDGVLDDIRKDNKTRLRKVSTEKPEAKAERREQELVDGTDMTSALFKSLKNRRFRISDTLRLKRASGVVDGDDEWGEAEDN